MKNIGRGGPLRVGALLRVLATNRNLNSYSIRAPSREGTHATPGPHWPDYPVLPADTSRGRRLGVRPRVPSPPSPRAHAGLDSRRGRHLHAASHATRRL